MANTRLYRVHGLSLDTIGAGATHIGGLQNWSSTLSFANVVESSADGALGSEDLDASGALLNYSYTTSDITKVNTILADASGLVRVAVEESGAATEQTVNLLQTTVNSMSLNFPYAADATLTIGGVARFTAGTDLATTLILTQAHVGGSAKEDVNYTQVYPTRAYRCNNFSFAPTGNGALTALHMVNASFSVTGRVIADIADGEAGHNAVEVVDWPTIDVSVEFREATAAASLNKAALLYTAIEGILTFDLFGRPAGASGDLTVTANALKWLGWTEGHADGFSNYVMSGKQAWRNSAGTAYDWTDILTIA